MNFTVTLNDLGSINRVYYLDENNEEHTINTTGQTRYSVNGNTITVTTNNNNLPTPRVDYVSTEADINLDVIGDISIKNVSDDNGNNLNYEANNNIIKIDDVEVGDSIVVNYDLEHIKIGALEYEDDGDKTSTPTKYGMRIRNNQGENVFETDDNGDIHMTGTIYAKDGIFNGVINAQAGEFSGKVLVGNEGEDYIALTTELEDGPTIASSEYINNRTQGWAIKGDGDAIFNNITARGCIKTAVFEYEEIEAVGGIFLFRPSSTIRTVFLQAERHVVSKTITNGTIDLSNEYAVKVEKVDNTTPTIADWNYDTMVLTTSLSGTVSVTYVTADLYITVEKPLQFREGEWVKLGVNVDGDVSNMLGQAGLTAIYKLEIYEQDETNPQFILRRAGNDYYTDDMIVDENEDEAIFTPDMPNEIYELEGSALVSFGYDTSDSTLYEEGIHNYGIGINSSADNIVLPERAISLFKTNIQPKNKIKVDFDYAGILGTLPSYDELGDVNEQIWKKMEGTQGIYTNNMYIGDKDQFVAFYDIGEEGKKLSIHAKEIYFGNPDNDSYTNLATITNSLDKYEGFIRISSDPPYIILGKVAEGNDFKTSVRITDDEIDFISGQNPTDFSIQPQAFLSGNVFNAPTAKFNEIIMKNSQDVNSGAALRWIARTNGNLSLKRVTEDMEES